MSFRSPLTVKKLKAPPPGETGQEAGYLRTLGEKQTHVSIKLLSGEVFKGWIEYYDHKMVRQYKFDVHRDFEPLPLINAFIGAVTMARVPQSGVD